MEALKQYERRIGRTRLEISGYQDDLLGGIYYADPSGKFEKGALDIVLEAAGAMIEELCEIDSLICMAVGPFEPVVPRESAELARAESMFADYRAWVADRTVKTIGGRHPFDAVWLGVDEGLTLLREIAARCDVVSAAESQFRFILLERMTEKSNGWDILHENGSTVLGRWDQNVRERPGALWGTDGATVESALGAAGAVLSLRLGEGGQ